MSWWAPSISFANSDVVMALAGYPSDYCMMLRDLISATMKGRERCWVDVSSSHSIHKRLVSCNPREKGKALQMEVGEMEIVFSDTGVRCYPSHMLGDNIVVKGCSLGDGGVWLSVEAVGGFWLEIHVPMQKIV